MEPERWARINQLFYAALEMDPGRRSRFIEAESRGDRDLSREVEALLAAHERAGDFLTDPALHVAAEIMADDPDASTCGKGSSAGHGQSIHPDITGKTVAGRYILRRELGRGGMGVVYEAWDTKLQCAVALKCISPDRVDNEEARKGILREARMAASLAHPYICRIFDTVEEGADLYVVMECCEGRNLRGGAFTIPEVVHIGCEIAEALAEAHSKGIIHRDIKPANVMMTAAGHVKIMDFGLAKRLPGRGPGMDQSYSMADTFESANSGITGSIPYMSPEQLRGEPLDSRSDIFSLGVTLYELAARHMPFSGATGAETIAGIIHGQPTPMAQYRKGVPESLERVIYRMLEKDPARRYKSASEVRAVLAQSTRRRLSSTILRRRIRRSHLRLAAAAAGIVLLGTFLTVWLIRVRESPPPAALQTESTTPATEADLLYNRALASGSQFSQAANQNAIALLTECVRLRPDDASARSALALEKLKKFWWYQGDAGHFKEATEQAAYAVKLDPSIVRGRVILDIADTLHSSDPRGYIDLAQCLKADPRQPEALGWLAMFFANTGDFVFSRKLIDRLRTQDPRSPYAGVIQAVLLIHEGDLKSAGRQIADLSLQFPNWDGSASVEMQRAISLSDVDLVRQAINHVQLINPDKPSVKLWKIYLKALEGSPVSEEERQALLPYIGQDYDLSALYARICVRLGERENALDWLQRSIERGNCDLVGLEHGDFKPLENESRFAQIKRSLKERTDSTGARIRSLIGGTVQ